MHRSAVTHQLQALGEAGQELERLTTIGLDRFAAFVADWDAQEVRTLTRLLVKFETTKAEVGRRAPPSRARRRPQP